MPWWHNWLSASNLSRWHQPVPGSIPERSNNYVKIEEIFWNFLKMHIFRVKIRFRYQYRINARFEKKKISESAPVPYSKNNKNGESTLVPYSKKTKIGESEPCASYDKDANSAISRCRFQALGPAWKKHVPIWLLNSSTNDSTKRNEIHLEVNVFCNH